MYMMHLLKSRNHIEFNHFNLDNNYNTFLTCGTLVFTSFTSSLNTSSPLTFDRKFNSSNRSPIKLIMLKNNTLFALITFIISTKMLQNLLILNDNLKSFINIIYINKVYFTIEIHLLVIIITSSISLLLPFILIIN